MQNGRRHCYRLMIVALLILNTVVIRIQGTLKWELNPRTFDKESKKSPISSRYKFGMLTDKGGLQHKPTGYEPKSLPDDVPMGRAMITDAGVSGGIDSNASETANIPKITAQNGDSDQAINVSMHSGKLQNVLYVLLYYVSSMLHNVMYCFAVDAII